MAYIGPLRRRWPLTLLVAVVLAGAGAAALASVRRERARRAAAHQAFMAKVPAQAPDRGYVGSDACKRCHPDEHGTWHASFHRTMTQYPTPQTVKGRFDGVPLRVDEGTVVPERRGDEFWVKAYSPSGALTGERRIGLLTGSHHMQVYWLTSAKGNVMEMFPYMFLFEEQRWAPTRDTFLADPKIKWSFQTWNLRCIQCHATAGTPHPRTDDGQMRTRTAELGISCEACHGPGSEHVTAHQGRGDRGRSDAADPTIVNPRRLQPRASSQVCGQCHAIKITKDLAGWLRSGFDYRPGDELEDTRPLMDPSAASAKPYIDKLLSDQPDYLINRFWDDGMVRVSGREWNGLARTPCHVRGTMSCTTCHSLHGYVSNDDQLKEGRGGNGACVGCHQPIQARLAEHTRHAPASTGSQCMNCHMPHTTYGLLKAIRSHEIDSPDVRKDVSTGRPNACNLCHLDRSLGWAAEHLTRWWGRPAVELPEDEQKLAAGLLWTLKGDAGQRALAAWHMGWQPAREAAGSDWMPALLTLALSDSYAAVRYIAARSLRRSPEFANMTYDYVAAPAALERQIAGVVQTWTRARRSLHDEKAARLLLRPDGSPLREEIEKRLAQRNERSLDLQE